MPPQQAIGEPHGSPVVTFCHKSAWQKPALIDRLPRPFGALITDVDSGNVQLLGCGLLASARWIPFTTRTFLLCRLATLGTLGGMARHVGDRND